MKEYKSLIRKLNHFPKEGIVFQDINPLLANPKSLTEASTEMAMRINEIMPFASKLLAVEARGFIMGGIIASMLECGFVPVRKKGKLPTYDSLKTIDYKLEYGWDNVNIDFSLLNYHDKIIIFDDVLATGGTAEATYKIFRQESELGNFAPLDKSNICFAFLLEIEALKGKDFLHKQIGIPKENIISLIQV